MNQYASTFISIVFLIIAAQSPLIAQEDSTKVTTKKSFIEANISINSARDFIDLNPPMNFTIGDTVSYFLSPNSAYEIQFKYTQDFAEQFSWYGGIYLGRSALRESILLRDSIFVFGTSSNSPPEFFSIQDREIYYASLSGGLRVSTRIFKNDRVYFNLGGKLTIYPKRDLSLLTTSFSQVRDENFTHSSSSTLDNSTKLNGSMEIDISYHLIPKGEKFRFIVGILADRSEREIFNITNDIILPENTHTFEQSYGGVYIGAYLGFAYVLDRNET